MTFKRLTYSFLTVACLSSFSGKAKSAGLIGASGSSFILDDTILQQLATSIKTQFQTNLDLINSKLDSLGATVQGVQATTLPPGTITAFAGASAPLGYVLCNGGTLSQTSYPALYAAIGTTFNLQVNPTTGVAYPTPPAGEFRVPDFRGIFVRAVGTNNMAISTSLGVWQDDATAKNSLSASASTSTISGTANSGVNLSHGHGISDPGHAHDTNFGRVQSALASNRGVIDNGGGSSYVRAGGASANTTGISLGASGTLDHSHSLSGSAAAQTITLGAGDTETRPQNKGVNYIIKY